MHKSVFLAKVIGWYCVILSLVILFRQQHLQMIFQQIAATQALLFIIGIFTLILGLIMVLNHNIWELKWPLLITLISWLTLLSGIFRLVYPETGLQAGLWIFENTSWLTVSAVIYLLIGVYLLYKAYSSYYRDAL